MPDPIDTRATKETRALYRFIQESSGRRIIMAQQEFPVSGRHEQEMEYIERVTGKLPLMRGLDFIGDDYDGVVERAKRWNDCGGIVTICWHTGVIGKGYPESKEETPDFGRLLDTQTPEHRQLMDRWDDAADALERLQQAGIPVLWRPFHEFDGQWFWWGKGGGDAFIALWRMMVRYFMEERGLHHLLWVLGYADDVRDGWYPGHDFCDIIGSDTYRSETTHAEAYQRLKNLDTDKPMAFHEIGLLPEPERFFEDNAVWSWLMPWHGTYLMESNTGERLRQVYSDPRMLTLQSGWNIGNFWAIPTTPSASTLR